MDPDFDSENPTNRDGPTAHEPAYQYSICLDAGRSRVVATADTKGMGQGAAEQETVGQSVSGPKPKGVSDPHTQMRVIAGQYRSRVLRTLPGVDVRPTADRLRETLFNVLCAGNPEALAESVWLDLYAGTGAVGIEALSRGAGMVHFVESSKPAAELIAENLKSLGIESGFGILKAEVRKALTQLEASGVVADFVFLDPPYRLQEEYAETLEALAKSTVMRMPSIVFAEHEKRFDPGDAFGELVRYRKLIQGDAGLSFYRRYLSPYRKD